MKIQGTVFRYGDNVDTDVIIPARYLNTPDAKELATHCMEDIDQQFARTVKSGDIIVAGRITDETTGQRFAVQPFPPFMRDLVSAGGLANYLRNRQSNGEGLP